MTDTALKERIIHGLSKWGKWTLIAILVMAGFYWLRIRPLPVKGYQVAQGEIVAEVLGTGTLEAKVQTVVSTKIPGHILDMRVDQGDQVRAGQALLRLDDSEFRQQVEIARSALDAARATVERMQADAVRSQATLEQSRIECRRRECLFTSESIAANEIDKRKEELKVAEADLEKTKAVAGQKMFFTDSGSTPGDREAITALNMGGPSAGIAVEAPMVSNISRAR